MAWRESTNHARALAERRLAGLARDWLPPQSPARPEGWVVEDVPARPRLQVGGWGRPALRGLALLVAVALAIAAYGVWLGRPRAVAEAPVRLASGVALPVASTSSAAPATAPEPAPGESAASAVVVVHVVGAVHRPGVVRLPAGSRVADAISAAGGVTRRRAEDTVNLARVLADGEQVVVGEQAVAAAPVAASGTPVVVDLNSATAEALDALPGIGPVLAARIAAWRTANGPFRSVDELGEVSGIGESILAQLRPLVRV